MIAPATLSLLAAGFWLVVACLIPFLRIGRRAALFWVMVLAGVPVLGWLTLHWGPVPGFGALSLGLWLLMRAPVAAIRRRRPPMHRGLH